MTTVHY